MSDAILVVNAGSSSIKFAIYARGATPGLRLRGLIDGLGSQPRFAANQPALYIAEGLLMYLPPARVAEIFREILQGS